MLLRQTPLYRVAGLGFGLRGSSVAGDATGFVVPEWGLHIDAGLRLDRDAAPQAVLLTHTHHDHARELPDVCRPAGGRGRTFNLFVGAAGRPVVQEYLLAAARLNAGTSRLQWNDALYGAKLVTADPAARWVGLTTVAEVSQTPARGAGARAAKRPRLPPVGEHHRCASAAARALLVRSFDLPDHRVPSTGYVVAARTGGAGGGPAPLLATVLDCGSGCAAAAIEAICTAPEGPPQAVLLECTYIDDAEASEARRRQHVLWSAVASTVARYPQVHFWLCHLSERYLRKGGRARLRQFRDTLPPHVTLTQ
jgi:ribonuclease Z